MVWLPGVDEVPMSIAMDDGTETKVTFFDVGDMTKQLFQKNTGDLIGLRGPFGTHYEWQPKQHLILVAGGYGAAPMYFVAKEALKDHCRIDFIVGARSKEHLLYLEEIQALSATTLHVSTDDGSMGHKGRNTEVLEKIISSVHSPQSQILIFACGPEMMLKRISQICAEKKTSCFMSLERYMKCGYGLCGNCVMDPLGIRLCTDGPVVSNEICVQLTDFGVYHRDALGKKHVF
jgi:dihydroorotate dehydrogenase electron transfer subunit